MGLEILIEALDEIKEEVKEIGYLSEDAGGQLTRYFGKAEDGLAARCLALSRQAQAASGEKDPACARNNSGDCKERILTLLGEEKRKLERWQIDEEEKESLELDSTLARLSLPSKEAVDKILRYETTIERQLYRAMNQLERLQRQRRGETVPPPISLEVSAER